MATIFSTHESLADTTTITTSNTNFTSVTPGTGGTITATSAHTRGGATSAMQIAPGSAASYAYWNAATAVFGAGLSRWMRAYVYLTGYPTATATLMGVFTSALGNIMSVRCSASTNKLQIYNASGALAIAGTLVVPLNSWFRVELFVLPDTATTGSATVTVFTTNPDGTTPDDTITTTTANFGTIAPDRTGFGLFAGTWAAGMTFSHEAASDTGAIGPDVSSTAWTRGVDDPTGSTDTLSALSTADWAFTHAVTIG